MIINVLCMQFNVTYMKYAKQHPERKSHCDNDIFNEIQAIKYVNFEYCNFPMEIDDDVNNSTEEFVEDNGSSTSFNVYGIHKDTRNSCEDSLVVNM